MAKGKDASACLLCHPYTDPPQGMEFLGRRDGQTMNTGDAHVQAEIFLDSGLHREWRRREQFLLK